MPGPAIVTLASCPVAYNILYRSPATLQGQNASGWGPATIDFLVGSGDWFTFAQFAAGTPTTITVGGSPITRIIPLSHPGASKLLCTAIDSECTGFYTSGNPDWLKNWSHTKVKCTFTAVPYAVDGSTPFMVVQTQASSKTYTLAGSKLAFADGTPIQADAGIDVPTTVYNVSIYQAPALDDSTVATYLASPVNSANVTFGNLVIGAGFLKFVGLTSQSTMTANFQQSYTRTISFEYRPINWNYFLKPDGTWAVVTKPGGGNVYATADLNNLLL